MISVKEIGKISERRGDLEVEWTINDIFSFSTENESYNSPKFSVSGSNFYIKIYPYGETENDSVGWISLYLMKGIDKSSQTYASYTLGVKRADGKVEKTYFERSWVFDKSCEGIGFPKVIQRAKLLRRKSEYAPSDVLTIFCALRLNQDFDCAERLDALSQNLKAMFLSKKFCDVTVDIKNETFSAHKSILAARSPVFAAMLDADMKENCTGTINIVDCDPELFENFLLYLYSGKLENLSSNAFELYTIADKYQVQELKSTCVGSIMGNLSVKSVCDAILLVYQFDESALKIKTQEFFNANFSKIVATTEWESLLKENYRAANEFLKNVSFKTELIE